MSLFLYFSSFNRRYLKSTKIVGFAMKLIKFFPTSVKAYKQLYGACNKTDRHFQTVHGIADLSKGVVEVYERTKFLKVLIYCKNVVIENIGWDFFKTTNCMSSSTCA